jgi:hypothetical protein
MIDRCLANRTTIGRAAGGGGTDRSGKLSVSQASACDRGELSGRLLMRLSSAGCLLRRSPVADARHFSHALSRIVYTGFL